jgi:hypothetical protein
VYVYLFYIFLCNFPTSFRLLHVDYDENKLYMIFEYLDLDLKKYMDSVRNTPSGFTPAHVRVSQKSSCIMTPFPHFH